MNAPASSEAPSPTKRVLRIVGISFATMVVIVASLAGVWWLGKQKATRERAPGKGPPLGGLAGVSITNEDICRELDELKSGRKPNIDFGWAHDHVLLMTNGDYIIFASRHGANNGFVDHLFLGHCSDGRWLYSTYHFCNLMAMVR